MANYAVSNLMGGTQQALASGGKTLIEVHAASTTQLRRIGVYEFEMGINGTPNATDCSIDWVMGKSTAAGTAGATPAPLALDPADAACLAVAGVNHTAEPTYTAANSLWSLGANQRASYRWIAKDDKASLWVAATNLNGVALYAKSATYNSTATATIYFQEQ